MGQKRRGRPPGSKDVEVSDKALELELLTVAGYATKHGAATRLAKRDAVSPQVQAARAGTYRKAHQRRKVEWEKQVNVVAQQAHPSIEIDGIGEVLRDPSFPGLCQTISHPAFPSFPAPSPCPGCPADSLPHWHCEDPACNAVLVAPAARWTDRDKTGKVTDFIIACSDTCCDKILAQGSVMPPNGW